MSFKLRRKKVEEDEALQYFISKRKDSLTQQIRDPKTGFKMKKDGRFFCGKDAGLYLLILKNLPN